MSYGCELHNWLYKGANCTIFGRRGAAMEHACLNACELHDWLYKGSHKLEEKNDGANCTIEKMLVLRFFVALEKFTTIVNCSNNYSDTQPLKQHLHITIQLE